MRIHILQHVPYESPGTIIDWAKEKNFAVSFTRFFEDDILPVPDDFDMLVIMGGPMNIYEKGKYPWLTSEKVFIQNCLAAKKKILGICLGSQLLADALGATVFPNNEKEIGWYPIYKAGRHPVSDLFPEEQITALHWHGDTFDLPENVTPLFYSEATKNQGFVYGDTVFALQFHWEIQQESLQELITHAHKDLTPGNFVQSAEEMLNHASGFEKARHQLRNLLDYIETL